MSSQAVKIYMPLLNEGTECWRPVSATPVEGDRYRIDEQHYSRDDEEWQFPPGSLVRCRLHTFSGGERELAAFELVQPM
jgi:hypothetical protein